jgi:hypothetical protein
VGQINAQIKQLAPALNAPAEPPSAITVDSSNKDVPIAFTARRKGGSFYIFAVAMRQGETRATFTLPNVKQDAAMEVLDESRSLTASGGRFDDVFTGYSVHLYRIPLAAK